MSYILDALRKSEQQRQATQPDNVTERILVNQQQTKARPIKWIAVLIVGNLLVIAYLFWFFSQKSGLETQNKISLNPTKQTPPASVTAKPMTIPNPQVQSTQKYEKSVLSQPSPQAPAPSIAELIEKNKAVENPKPVKKVPEKKQPVIKKRELAGVETRPTPQKDYPAPLPETPIAKSARTGTQDLNDLPYPTRNGLPDLTINVFSYAQRPEDRFVIIDMVKYKTGQLVKGSVKLKEIRADSILLQSGDETFKVDRP